MCARVHIYTVVREQGTVPAMVRYAMANILSVIVLQIMYGVAVLAFVIVHLNMLVRERDTVREVVRHAAENIRAVTVPHITVGTVALVHMFTVMCARVDIRLLIRE